MRAIDHSTYMPILLAKSGERGALDNIETVTCARFVPLLVVPPIEWDYEMHRPKKSVAEHLHPLPDDLVLRWGNADAFIDLQYIDDAPIFGGLHPLSWLCDQSKFLGLRLTAVASYKSSPAYRAAAAGVAADGVGLCLRLPVGDWPAGNPAQLDAFLGDLGLTPRDVDLVLDAGDDVGSNTARQLASDLVTLPYLDEWHSLTVAMTGIPADAPTGRGLHHLVRHDWRIYKVLRGLTPSLPRIPSFADYGINGTSPGTGLDPKLLTISASLRYTTADEWLLAKGGLYKGNHGQGIGALAVPPAATELVESKLLLSSGHCSFESWIRAVANRDKPGSSPTTWRMLGTEHHIRLVLEQVASLSAP